MEIRLEGEPQSSVGPPAAQDSRRNDVHKGSEAFEAAPRQDSSGSAVWKRLDARQDAGRRLANGQFSCPPVPHGQSKTTGEIVILLFLKKKWIKIKFFLKNRIAKISAGQVSVEDQLFGTALNEMTADFNEI